MRRYLEAFGDAPIDNFYSDSMIDAPLARMARQAFWVRGDNILPWPK